MMADIITVRIIINCQISQNGVVAQRHQIAQRNIAAVRICRIVIMPYAVNLHLTPVMVSGTLDGVYYARCITCALEKVIHCCCEMIAHTFTVFDRICDEMNPAVIQ